MAIPLSDEQKTAVDAHPGEPVPVVDDRTNTTYVLVPADVYGRLKGLVYDDSEHDIAEWYPAMAEACGRAGWDDPVMDEYNNYDENLRKLRGEPG